MHELILATRNAHKAEEAQKILGEDFEVITQTEAGLGDIEVVEDGSTFEENAEKKAKVIAEHCGGCVIADDSGLCVDYLSGAPGIYTARFAGENATDNDNIDKLLRTLDGVLFNNRTARFVCVIALCEKNKEPRFFRGECKGHISLVRRGTNGFGYDPIFIPNNYAVSMAELPDYIKNAISHRGRALAEFKKEILKV